LMEQRLQLFLDQSRSPVRGPRLRHTWRLGTQVGLSPRFNLSMSSALSETARETASLGVTGLGGLSGMGPSHRSVRMLSSERRRVVNHLPSPGGVWMGIGAESGYCEPESREFLRPISSSSRNMGILRCDGVGSQPGRESPNGPAWEDATGWSWARLSVWWCWAEGRRMSRARYGPLCHSRRPCSIA
jgi:hypothetical protein